MNREHRWHGPPWRRHERPWPPHPIPGMTAAARKRFFRRLVVLVIALLALARSPGRVFSRFELINRVQGHDYDGYERTIDAHVKNLRRKIEPEPGRPRYVLTVHGVGYRFADD